MSTLYPIIRRLRRAFVVSPHQKLDGVPVEPPAVPSPMLELAKPVPKALPVEPVIDSHAEQPPKPKRQRAPKPVADAAPAAA